MSALAKTLEIGAEGKEPKKWRRRFVGEQEAPAHAILWQTPGQKAKRLDAWRAEIGKLFPESGRILRIAWTLEWLFGSQGFAFPTDAFLSQKLAIPVNKIQSGLSDLERAGAIVRASVYIRGRTQRRIWPSSKMLKVIPPTMGGMDTPHDGDDHTPHDGGTEYLRRKPSPRIHRIGSIAEAARLDAERREAARRRSGAAAPIEGLPHDRRD